MILRFNLKQDRNISKLSSIIAKLLYVGYSTLDLLILETTWFKKIIWSFSLKYYWLSFSKQRSWGSSVHISNNLIKISFATLHRSKLLECTIEKFLGWFKSSFWNLFNRTSIFLICHASVMSINKTFTRKESKSLKFRRRIPSYLCHLFSALLNSLEMIATFFIFICNIADFSFLRDIGFDFIVKFTVSNWI